MLNILTDNSSTEYRTNPRLGQTEYVATTYNILECFHSTVLDSENQQLFETFTLCFVRAEKIGRKQNAKYIKDVPHRLQVFRD